MVDVRNAYREPENNREPSALFDLKPQNLKVNF